MCGVIMDRGLVTVRNGKVPVNLTNVHNQTITLHKAKTLGQLQPVIYVVVISVSSSQCHGETVQKSLKLLNMNDVPENTRDVLDEETVLNCRLNKLIKCVRQYWTILKGLWSQ